MKRFFCLMLVLVSMNISAQTINQHDKFWDGATLWEVDAIYKEGIVFMTGTGEIYLSLKEVAGKQGEYKLVPGHRDDKPSIPGAQFGWRVQYIRQEGVNFLVVRKPDGDAMWAMLLTTDDLSACHAKEEALERELPSDILSTTLLNRHYLSKIPNKKELRLMRNEIWARHGYRFSSPDLKEWFGNQPWYKPCNDNNAIKLNIVEQTNVQLIKSEEESRKPIPASRLAGDWSWVGKDVPEVILSLALDGKGKLYVDDFYLYRLTGFDHPTCSFDGETLIVRKDLDDNSYAELALKLNEEGDLVGQCALINVLPEQYDCPITLRKNYFEYSI